MVWWFLWKGFASDESGGISNTLTLPLSSSTLSPISAHTKHNKRAGEKTPKTLLKMMERHRENERYIYISVDVLYDLDVHCIYNVFLFFTQWCIIWLEECGTIHWMNPWRKCVNVFQVIQMSWRKQRYKLEYSPWIRF